MILATCHCHSLLSWAQFTVVWFWRFLMFFFVAKFFSSFGSTSSSSVSVSARPIALVQTFSTPCFSSGSPSSSATCWSNRSTRLCQTFSSPYSSLPSLAFSSASAPTGRVRPVQISSSFWFWRFCSGRLGSTCTDGQAQRRRPSSTERERRTKVCDHPPTSRAGFSCSNTWRGSLHWTRFDRPTWTGFSLKRLPNSSSHSLLMLMMMMICQFSEIAALFLSTTHFSCGSSSKCVPLIGKTPLLLQGGWVWLGKAKSQRQQRRIGWNRDWS